MKLIIEIIMNKGYMHAILTSFLISHIFSQKLPSRFNISYNFPVFSPINIRPINNSGYRGVHSLNASLNPLPLCIALWIVFKLFLYSLCDTLSPTKVIALLIVIPSLYISPRLLAINDTCFSSAPLLITRFLFSQNRLRTLFTIFPSKTSYISAFLNFSLFIKSLSFYKFKIIAIGYNSTYKKVFCIFFHTSI